MSCHESNDRLDSIRSFETVATESGRSIPLNVPPACEPQAPVPTSLGLTFSGSETATRKDAALEAATDGVLTFKLIVQLLRHRLNVAWSFPLSPNQLYHDHALLSGRLSGRPRSPGPVPGRSWELK